MRLSTRLTKKKFVGLLVCCLVLLVGWYFLSLPKYTKPVGKVNEDESRGNEAELKIVKEQSRDVVNKMGGNPNVPYVPFGSGGRKSLNFASGGNRGARVSKENVIVELFPNWTTKDPQDKVFARRLFIYSVIVAIHPEIPSNAETEIHFSTFQVGQTPIRLTCCLLLNSSISDQAGVHHETEAILDSWDFFSLKPNPPTDPKTRLTRRTFAIVYRCRFPLKRQQLQGSYATLTSAGDACPVDMGQFMPVHHPEVKPGGLAICAKVAFGSNLNANVLVEWFEIQRILGVDRVRIYDLGNKEPVKKVFRYYQDIGLLHLLPYKLPGPPYGRKMGSFPTTNAVYPDDKEMNVFDCRLRSAGFDYVEGVDFDEVILPRNFTALKPFIKDQFAKHPTAASLHFKPQCFIFSWEPVDPKAPLYFLRYMRSTKDVGWIWKYIYRPERTHQALTHFVYPYQNYTKVQFVNNSEAAIFHYRAQCKPNWPFKCEGTRVDRSMLRFQHDLIPAVLSVRQKLGLPSLP